MPNPLLSAKKQTADTVSQLGRLIARMALDSSLHRAYLDDPEAVIADAGLGPEEQAALRSNDWSQVARLLGPDDRGGGDAHKDPGGGGISG